MVLVGKSARFGDLPDSHLVPMYDQRHSIHRIDPDSHSRGAGARHGRLFRSRRLRRTADAENRLRHSDDHSGRHPHHRRRQHNDLHDTLSETVPETPDPKTVTSLRSRTFLSVPVRHGPARHAPSHEAHRRPNTGALFRTFEATDFPTDFSPDDMVGDHGQAHEPLNQPPREGMFSLPHRQ